MQGSRSFRQIRASPFSVFIFHFRMKQKRAWPFKRDFRLWCKEEIMWCKREKLKQLINFVFREILSLSFVFGAYFFEFRGRNLACFVIENPIYYRAFRSGSLHCGPPSAGYRFTESCLVLVLSSLLLPWERLLFFPYKLIFFYFF